MLSSQGASGMAQTALVLQSHYYGGATRLILGVNDEQLTMQERFPFGQQPRAGDVLDIVICMDEIRVIPSG